MASFIKHARASGIAVINSLALVGEYGNYQNYAKPDKYVSPST